MKAKADPDSMPAPALAPGAPTTIGGDESKPRRGADDDTPDVEAVLVACACLARAVQHNAQLREAGEKAGLRVRILARRCPRLTPAADSLRDAAKAAGTLPIAMSARDRAEQDAVAGAVQFGAGVNEANNIARLSREYDSLADHGLTPRCSRRDYIKHNLSRTTRP